MGNPTHEPVLGEPVDESRNIARRNNQEIAQLRRQRSLPLAEEERHQETHPSRREIDLVQESSYVVVLDLERGPQDRQCGINVGKVEVG